MTHIEKFIAEHPDNWRQLISAAPYNINVKEEEGKILLKYTQVAADTDWSSPLVRECRGIILDAATKKVICHAFDRFYNYGEKWADDIDWESATALEKIDGSIIKMYMDNEGKFCISTNGSINAFNSTLSSFINGKADNTFGAKVQKLLKEKYLTSKEKEERFLRELSEGSTAIFELVSLDNQVVIKYEVDELYYLGSRNIRTNTEFTSFFMSEIFPVPKRYNISTMSIEEIIAFVNDMHGKEGIVVKDKFNKRVKIKNAEYLLQHRCMTRISLRDIFDVVDAGEVSEWKVTIPNLEEKIKEMENAYNAVIAEVKTIVSYAISAFDTDKKCAEYFNTFDGKMPALLFAEWRGKRLPKTPFFDVIKERYYKE